jgi:hypothetical protein
MDRYVRVETQKEEQQAAEQNEVRITAAGKTRNYIGYATSLLTEKGHTSVVLKAMGKAINKTVTIGEKALSESSGTGGSGEGRMRSGGVSTRSCESAEAVEGVPKAKQAARETSKPPCPAVSQRRSSSAAWLGCTRSPRSGPQTSPTCGSRLRRGWTALRPRGMFQS